MTVLYIQKTYVNVTKFKHQHVDKYYPIKYCNNPDGLFNGWSFWLDRIY